MKVVFTELADRALTTLFGETERREAWRASIRLHLSQDDAIDRSRRLPRPDDKNLYVFSFGGGIYATFEHEDEQRTVWMVGEIRGEEV